MNGSNHSQAVLVAGATGFLGTEICRQLKESGRHVVGLVRASSAAEKVERLKAMGVQTVEGDMKDPASLTNAFKGIDAVISSATAIINRQQGDSIQSVDEAGQQNVVDCAKAAGVRQFVYVSFPPLYGEFPLQQAKRSVEKYLMDSGLTYTILQPTFFMEVWLSPAIGFDFANAKAVIYGEGKNKISWIGMKDVAAFAVAALDNELALNKIIQLGGPEALSPLEVVKLFEEKTGKRFSVDFVPVEALKTQKSTAADDVARSFAGLMLGYAEGSEIDMQNKASHYAVRLTSVNDYATTMTSNHTTA